MNHAPGRDDLQLADYAGVLRRRWWLILALAVIGTLVSIGYFKVSHKVYIATASVYVTANGGTANQVAGGRTTGTVNLDTEAQVVQSATVAQAAAKLMHATETLPQLIKRVSVTVPANSQVLSISCQASSATGAASCAQSFAQAFLSYTSSSTSASANSQISALQSKISALESASAKLTVEVGSLPDNSPQRAAAQEQLNSDQGQLSSLNSQVAQLTAELTNPSGGSIISNAIPPSSASSPKPLLIFPSGLLAGLLIGLILSFIVDRRDRRVRSPRDLMKINVPVLMSLAAEEGLRSSWRSPPPGRRSAGISPGWPTCSPAHGDWQPRDPGHRRQRRQWRQPGGGQPRRLPIPQSAGRHAGVRRPRGILDPGYARPAVRPGPYRPAGRRLTDPRRRRAGGRGAAASGDYARFGRQNWHRRSSAGRRGGADGQPAQYGPVDYRGGSLRYFWP
jgi:capsular polysaccharide biosynthesis protein